jgi:hypothetical protein
MLVSQAFTARMRAGECLALGFPDDTFRVFIISQRDEFRAPQVIRARPLQEPDLRDGFRTKPNALPHLLGREPLTSSAGADFREIDERTLPRLKMSDLLENVAPSCRKSARLSRAPSRLGLGRDRSQPPTNQFPGCWGRSHRSQTPDLD